LSEQETYRSLHSTCTSWFKERIRMCITAAI